MKLVIDIPKEFEQHFNQDGFEDSLSRVLGDIEGYGLKFHFAGKYEKEVIIMLREVFKNGKPLPEHHGDCVSRQAVKDMLTAEWTKYMPMELDMNLSFILDKINALPSVIPKTEWIPVSERLPEGYCLFCDIDGDVYYGHIYDKKWWAEGQNDRIKNVTAWMPLPEPYKESEEEK
jgi:hypothetical protein